MSLLRARGLAITASEFAQCLAPFQRHRTASSDAVPSRSPRDMAIAVSGGVDSMALATLMARHYSSPGSTTRLHALIVDHKLRDNSTAEAAFVAQQVQLLGITPQVLTLDWSASSLNDPKGFSGVEHKNRSNVSRLIQKPDKAHLETQARLERYKVISQRCHALQIQDLFVGHHAGDQVETTLFRFTRASGIDGLAGIQGVAPVGVVNVADALGISVIRPLLTVDKDRLRATCEDAGTKWVEDESNKSLDYQRNVIRHHQQHIDALVGPDPRSELYPLSTPALLAFRDRMDRHRKVAWSQVRPWLKQVQFDTQNGVCHIQLQSAAAETDVQEHVAWLQTSQDHVATRLLSYLMRWVSCKDHAPRLDDVQAVLRQLRKTVSTPLNPAVSSEEAVLEADPESKSDSDRSTGYRRTRRRTSKSAPQPTPAGPADQEAAFHQDSSASTRPLNSAGVMFSPPRRTKGLRDRWTMSRQPMSHAEQLSASLILPVMPLGRGSVCEDKTADSDQTVCTSVLWDHRFFIDIAVQPPWDSIEHTSCRIRPLSLADVQGIRKQFPNQDDRQKQQGLKELETWLETVSGNVKYTIPVVCLQDTFGSGLSVEQILSIPSVGLHLHSSTFAVACRFRSNSNPFKKDSGAADAANE
ncbi:unnamed protein product [Mortierella alpina]